MAEIGVPTEADIGALPFLAGGRLHYDQVGGELAANDVQSVVCVIRAVPWQVQGQTVGHVPEAWMRWDLSDADRELIAQGASVYVSQLGQIVPTRLEVGHVTIHYTDDFADRVDEGRPEGEVPDA